MTDNSIRVGRVSSINYEEGTVKVFYSDKDNSVTKDIPYIMNGEYRMPNIDDMVLVLHLSNGSSMGIVVGTFWNGNNKPIESGKGLYRKELGIIPGEAFLRYDSNTKELSIKADTIRLVTENETTTF